MPIPSPFVVEWLPQVAAQLRSGSRAAPWRALDLAMGNGRHVAALADAGFRPFGVDVSLEAVRQARLTSAAAGTSLRAFCADMTRHPLPPGWFDLVLVTRYLDRPRMPAIAAAVAPGGFLMYETFTRHQLRLPRGPRAPEHLLAPGELATFFPAWERLFYDEPSVPEAVARLVARRPA